MTEIFTVLTNFLEQNVFLALLSAFIWGVFSIILSPCHLASIPLVIGVISNKNVTIKKSFLISLIFSIGILVTVGIIGVVTSLLGKIMGDTGIIGNIVIAVILFVVALYFLGAIKLNFLSNIFSQPNFSEKNFFTAFLMGLFFGIGLGPCTFAYLSPLLGVIFKTANTNIFFSILILLFFGIGHTAIIVLFGTFGKLAEKYLRFNEKTNALKIVKIICGVLLILGSLYFVYDILHRYRII